MHCLCIKWHRSAIPLYNEAFYLFGLVVKQDDRPEPSVAVVLSVVDCYVSENKDAPSLSLPSDCFLVEFHDSRVHPAIECHARNLQGLAVVCITLPLGCAVPLVLAQWLLTLMNDCASFGINNALKITVVVSVNHKISLHPPTDLRCSLAPSFASKRTAGASMTLSSAGIAQHNRFADFYFEQASRGSTGAERPVRHRDVRRVVDDSGAFGTLYYGGV